MEFYPSIPSSPPALPRVIDESMNHIAWLMRTHLPNFTLTYIDLNGTHGQIGSTRNPLSLSPSLLSAQKRPPTNDLPSTTTREICPPPIFADAPSDGEEVKLIEAAKPIFENWGVQIGANGNAEVTDKLVKVFCSQGNLVGSPSKKTAVALINSLYPARRKHYPYSSKRCPKTFWPPNVEYKDPSHLNTQDRTLFLIWAYCNPYHSFDIIIEAHEMLAMRHRIHFSAEWTKKLLELRKSISC